MSRNIKKDYFWNTLGVLLQNAISPLLLLVVTRVNGIYESGVFSFAFAISLVLWALAMWGGRTYQVSDVNREFSSQSYITVRVLLSVLVLGIAVVFSFANSYTLQMILVIMALTLFKIIESYADVIYGVLQKNNKLYISGISLTAKAIIGAFLFISIDLMTKNIVYASLSVALVNLLILLAYDIRQAKKSEKDILKNIIDSGHIKEALKIMKKCLGVFVIFFLPMFSLNIPRYFIEKFSPQDVGYFGVIAMPITLIVLLITFILQPNILNLSQLYDSKKYKKFSVIVNKIMAFSLLIGLVVLIVSAFYGPEILTFIFGVDFYNYRLTLILIVIGGLASALVTVYLNIFVITRNIKMSLITLIVTNLLLLVISMYMVNGNGNVLLIGVGLYAVISIIQLIILVFGYFLYHKRNLYKK